MTNFYLIRHGAPDYTEIDKRKYPAFGNDLASLSDLGAKATTTVASQDILSKCELIITSPYTRTLQTAAILSKELNIDFKVELDLMEWLPDKTYKYEEYKEVVIARKEYEKNNGIHFKSNQLWEEKPDIIQRVNKVLDKYTNYSNVLVVTHGMIITALTDTYKPEYLQIVKYQK